MKVSFNLGSEGLHRFMISISWFMKPYLVCAICDAVFPFPISRLSPSLRPVCISTLRPNFCARQRHFIAVIGIETNKRERERGERARKGTNNEQTRQVPPWPFA